MAYHDRMDLTAGMGLATLFAGIWASDAQLLPALHLDASYLGMRLVSFAIYVAFAGIVLVGTRVCGHDASRLARDDRRRAVFIAVTSCIGLGLFALGETLLHLDGFVTASTGNAWLCLFMMKSVGAPLSIGLVYLFGRVHRENLVRVSLVGMVGALVMESVLGGLGFAATLDSDAVTFAASALLLISCLCLLTGLRLAASATAHDDPENPGCLLLKPVGQVIDRSFIMEAVVAAMMMGFLRGSALPGRPYTAPVVAVVLALLALLAWRKDLWGLREVFSAAILFAAAGILLGPLLNLTSWRAGDMLCNVGLALFETAVWVLAVKAARSCRQMLLAAALARLVVVCGHLLGSLLAQGANALAAAGLLAVGSSALCLVFIYLVMLLTFSRLGSDQLAFMPFTYEDVPVEYLRRGDAREHDRDGVSTGAPDGAGAPPADGAASGGPEASDMVQAFWQEPCGRLARAYGLTGREEDVLMQLARGRSLAYMSELFVLSPNTVKMHIRHIYDKLDVHSKQGVIDMVERTRAEV